MANGSGQAERKPIEDRLREATRPDMVQIAPNKFVPYRKGQTPPGMSLCTWSDNGDGSFSPIPVTERMIRMTSKVARILGVDSERWHTLRRLAEAGMVELIQITPGCTLLNLDSWYNHLRRCAETPDMWTPGSPAYKAYVMGLRKQER